MLTKVYGSPPGIRRINAEKTSPVSRNLSLLSWKTDFRLAVPLSHTAPAHQEHVDEYPLQPIPQRNSAIRLASLKNSPPKHYHTKYGQRRFELSERQSYGSLCGGYQDSLQDYPDNTPPVEHRGVWREDYSTSQPIKEDAGTGHPGETGLPTDNTMVKLAGNALNWLHTCMQILEEHYLESLGHLTKKLENIHLSNWPEAFQVATRWAKKKFERRLHPTTLDIAEKTFTPILTPRSTTRAVSTSNGVASSEADISPQKPGTGMEC
ncbi:hypothetical protein SKAU_G00137280 [Synaphobranchus kaupii]|uniref:Uncharacterized protein n=1 Tax=Synaphobranchus kaupii TaxID=118154 RepID=A0A9Q1FRN5_SYNKA|nr:hypothetical protein SKAU_G00137280 [Synaphobranchus kaupii]